ncbi:Uncharacterized conserved protein YbjQ, UPF0145 family [Eubacterium maltosivorans]|uniref:YbjQ family protein n=1 Tax=Eubacterium TaxID=1730 RepID=UPI0008818742|nr:MULTISPECIES: heavy metal-binding domain-containing protein [Eubacterium]MDO5433518.1 heavy metal-binding domain-containing protein [Eubacterium sp.]WPK81525.1 hypothetical protein EUMA32_29800 [Eubacterium maltosivorans]SDP63557.1 Uncharacterized conserved protein YbjQ, UPF0145 family [Eubacterium maltosivorans]
MLLVTKDTISGKAFEELGLVKGNTVQSVHMGKDFMSGLKTLVGGELKSYNEMMTTARDTATNRMIEQAHEMGADAIVAVRYTSDAIVQGAAEFLAYGTAVKFI